MTVNNQPTDEALLSTWLSIPGNGDMYADVVQFARAVLAEYGAAPVNDNAACGAQNGECEGQDAVPTDTVKLDLEAVEQDLQDMAASAFETGMAFGLSRYSFENLASDVFAYARRRIEGE